MLELINICYNVGEKELLKNISLNISWGNIVAITGPNGAGKTTLLKSISKEISNKGQILFKGKDIKYLNYKDKATQIGVFSQQYSNFIPLSVQEVVTMGRYPYFNNTPNKEDLDVVNNNILKTDIIELKDEPYDRLSGGEKQRTHLARVFSQLDNNGIKNKLLLLDEPLNNLDVYHQYKTMQHVKEFSRKNNISIVVMHDLNIAAQFADIVLLLKNGSLIAKGKPQEVFTQENIKQAYNFPCKIINNPITHTPMVVFGK